MLDVGAPVVLDVLPAEAAAGPRDVDDDGLAGLGGRGGDGDEDGCGVLAVLVLCQHPELPAVPPLCRSDPQAGLALCRLYLDIFVRTDRLVVKEPGDPRGRFGNEGNLQSDHLVVAEYQTVRVFLRQLQPGGSWQDRQSDENNNPPNPPTYPL